MSDSTNGRVILATPAPVSHRTAEECMGLGYLAAHLRKHGFEVVIIDAWLEGLSPVELADRILKASPVLCIGFSAYQSNMHIALKTLNHLKSHGFNRPTIAGGYGPTFHSEEFLKAGFDYVVRGDGEEVLLALCQDFQKGAIPRGINGLSYMEDGKIVSNPPKPLSIPMDKIFFPDRDTLGLTLKRKNPVHVLTSRGCAANCLFCSITSFQRENGGEKWRQRGITNFVDEIELLYQKGVRSFKVVDDSLIEPPRDSFWCKSLADELERRNIKATFRSSIRANRVSDETLFHLKRAGFVAFSCGIENFSPAALKRMHKSATLEDNIRALKEFKKHGIYVQAGQILFDRETSMEELRTNYEYMKKFDWMISKGVFTEMYAAEGTPFTNLLKKMGKINETEQRFGNYRYSIEDPVVQKAHYCLKTWHKAHMGIYDKTIDPLSAPKDLSAEALKDFYSIYQKIRIIDLGFMEESLRFVQDSPAEPELEKFVSSRLQKAAPLFEEIAGLTDAAYSRHGLLYDAADNPFI